MVREHALRILHRGRERLPAWPPPRLWVALGACFLLALAATGLLLVDGSDPPELLLFIGRFHPMMVHFPIALILLAAIMEGVAALYRPFRALRHSTEVVLFMGAVSALGAVVAGYLHAMEGGYDPRLVGLHMWLGIGVALGAMGATLLKIRSGRRGRRSPDRVYSGALAATVVLLLLTGHVGGSLTHGAGYLTHYLPDGVRALLGPSEARAAARIENVDSALVYQDLVAPLLSARCASCHGEGREKGRLRLDTREGLLKGGDDGVVIVAGVPEESELLRRITLPPGHEEVMPANGAPLDVGETELIRWWIANGASFEQRVADIEEIPTAVTTLLNRIAPPREEKKEGLYALAASPAPAPALATARSAGYRVQPVAADLPLLHVTAVNARARIGDGELSALLPLAEQITWLDLAGTRVGDAGLLVLARMPNLTRLFLANTAVGDAGLKHLQGLPHLAYLNLHGTAVTDAGLESLAALEGLRSLYLWRTRVTDQGVQALRQRLPDLQITVGNN